MPTTRARLSGDMKYDLNDVLFAFLACRLFRPIPYFSYLFTFLRRMHNTRISSSSVITTLLWLYLSVEGAIGQTLSPSEAYCPSDGIELRGSGIAYSALVLPAGTPKAPPDDPDYVWANPGGYGTFINMWIKPKAARIDGVGNTLMYFAKKYVNNPSDFRENWIGYSGEGYPYVAADEGLCIDNGMFATDAWTPDIGRWIMFSVLFQPTADNTLMVTYFRNGVNLHTCTFSWQMIGFTVHNLKIGQEQASGGGLQVGEILIVQNLGGFGSGLPAEIYEGGSSSTLDLGASLSFDVSNQFGPQMIWWRFQDGGFSSSGTTPLHVSSNYAYAWIANAQYGFERYLSTQPNAGSTTNNVFFHQCACVTAPSGCSPCLYSGPYCATGHFTRCLDGPTTANCTCSPGYTGTYCETNIDECASRPCASGATCVDGINNFTCACVPGTSGVSCQIDIDECASNPCRNGGTCGDVLNGFICQCVPGYTGAICQTDTDECASIPCTGGKTCIDLLNGYVCVDGQEPFCHPALMFNGSTVNIARSGVLAMASQTDLRPLKPFTMSMWYAPLQEGGGPVDETTLYPSHFALADQDALILDPPNRGLSLGIGVSPLGLTVWYGNVSCISSSAAVSTGWHQYVGMGRLTSASQMELALFVDGVRASATSGTCLFPFDPTRAAAITGNLRIEVGRQTNGALANMRMWQLAFTDAEVLSDYKFRSHYTFGSQPMVWVKQSIQTISASSADTSIGYLQLQAGGVPLLQSNVQGIAEFPSRVSLRPCRCPIQTLTPINPCSSNSTCVDNPSLAFGKTINQTAPCNCSTPGYIGYSCEHRRNGCDSNPCLNGATCSNGVGPFQYTCSCAFSWIGSTCDQRHPDYLTSRACTYPSNRALPSGSSSDIMTRSRYLSMMKLCNRLFPDGSRVFDPLTGWCKHNPKYSMEMFQYFSLQQYCPQRGANFMISQAYANETTAISSMSFSRSEFACGVFRPWNLSDISYFDGSCPVGQLFDFTNFTCVPDEYEEYCGVGALPSGSCQLDCYTNNTCTRTNSNCECAASGTSPHCGYKVQTDLCLTADLYGKPGKTNLCDVFTKESFNLCPTPVYNSTVCTEVCRCAGGMGDVPGSGRRCSGYELPCAQEDAIDFCGSSSQTCRKRCDFSAVVNAYTQPTGYCAFVVGSCGTLAHPTESFCVFGHSEGSSSLVLQTYNYSASLGGSTTQVLTASKYGSSCICNPAYTGIGCGQSNCPLGCSSHGTCANGKCTCTAGVPNQYTGCGCQLDQLAVCMTNGDGCLNETSASQGCQPCSTFGTCSPAYQNVTYGPSYACKCDASHSGEFCMDARCPNNCISPTHGKCIVPTDGVTAPYCMCVTTASSNDKVWGGADCSVDVTSACGAPGPGQNTITCNAHGSCAFNSTLGAYACTCTQGWTGPQCQNQPCNPPCSTHSSCVTTTSTAQCVCDDGWLSQNQNNAVCTTSLCGTLALPMPTGKSDPKFICQCTNSSFDSTTCNTNIVDNTNKCCKNPACPIAQNGHTCGDNAQVNLYNFSPLPQCLNGNCQCNAAYRSNSTSRTCIPYCDPDPQHSISRPCVSSDGLTCVGCNCMPGYDPGKFCYETICQNGGTLNVVGGAPFCSCTMDWGGQTCTVPVCGPVGHVNSTTGHCECPFPFSGQWCGEHLCKNGGSPVPLGGGLYECACPAIWGGATCDTNSCQPYGFPAANGTACICDAAHSGKFCQTSLCLNSGEAQNGTCTCPDPQFTGMFCQYRRCSVTGTYNEHDESCTCSETGVYRYNIFENNCTLSLCGSLGTPAEDGMSCNCMAGTILRARPLTVIHPIFCEPVCLNGGVFSPSTLNCTCPNGYVQPFCSKSGAPTTTSSSSTGVGQWYVISSASPSHRIPYHLHVLLPAIAISAAVFARAVAGA